MRIFIHRGTQTFGPYLLEDVLRELSNGSLMSTDMASYDGGGNRFVPLSTVPGVAGSASARPGAPSARARLGCGGWIAAAVGLLFLIGIIGSLITKDNNSSVKGQPHHRPSPHEFGQGLGRELLRHATTDSGSGGMVIFAQGCRAENPTVKTYSNAQYQQFLNGLMDAYIEWRRNGYTVPDGEIRDNTPSASPTRVNTPAVWNTPRPPYPTQARMAHIAGTGMCHIVFGADGHVDSAVMTTSTGSNILDSSTTNFVKTNWTGAPDTTKDVSFSYNQQ